MRNAVAQALCKAAEEDDRIRIVAADISPVGQLNELVKKHPDRFINVGVAEQSMIGLAAGLALRGLRPFCYTIAPFALYRPFEFIRDDICYQNLPVTIIGMGAGLVYSTLGATHHSIEDIAVACAIPNMQVMSPGDPIDAAEAVEWCAKENEGPVYLRIGKAGEPFIQARYADYNDPDTCILFHGAISALVNEVYEALDALVFCVRQLKPLHISEIQETLSNYKRVLVIEEHVPRGGLASMVKEIAWDMRATCDLRTYTLKDEFISCYGSHKDILAAHGLTAERIINDCKMGSRA